ncbi:MAG TPA: polymer-forming cytoskeletal protein [Candidatus Acidoferrum sp.]|nr:polymer-forming cytoskeletal protein [Candidatus Acidoferrum sp.]
MKKNGQSTNNTSLIAKGMEFHGDVHFSGILEIEGLVVGNIIAHPDVVAEVRIREAGEVKGFICVPVVIVNGLVEGDIYSSNHIELAAKARVTGNVFYHLMEMVLGCRVQGQLTHKSSAEIAKVLPPATNLRDTQPMALPEHH